MKGLILCAGKGSRLRPLTFSRPKHLLPLMNKSVLFYGIELLIQAGIKEIAVVVSPVHRHVFEVALQEGKPWNITISLIEQAEPNGLADAVRVAKGFIQSDDFLLYLGDNIIDGSLEPLIERFQAEKLDGLISVSQVEHPEQFGVVELNGEQVSRVIEKPANPPSNLAINGIYLFRHTIFDAISQITPSARGEYEITDAIQQFIDDGCQLGVFRSPYWWKDTGQPKDLLICNQYFLKQVQTSSILGTVDDSSILSSPVIIGENSQIINSVIRGPVIIGANAIIENAVIGPYTSIADKVYLSNCVLENSIVMENTELVHIPHHVRGSIIGGDVKIKGDSSHHNQIQLWVGDYSHIHY